MKKYLLFVLISFLTQTNLSFSLQAQTVKKDFQYTNQLTTSTDSLIHQAARTYLSNTARLGLSVGIYHNNETITYHYGSTQQEKQVLPTNKTIYEIGSISKTFTGTLLAQAVKDKKLKLEDDVRMYLDGDYPNLAYQGQPIRVGHLVSHISGLPNFLPDNPGLFQTTSSDSLPFVLSRILNNYSKQDFLNDLHNVKLDTIPGYKFRYSNSSPQLLKYILERVYQKSFADLLKIYLLQPLKMKHTTSRYKEVKVKHLAKGYNSKGNFMPYIPENLDAAGGIFSTIPDMLQYLKFHLDETNEVVALSHQVTTGDINQYAIGLNWQETITSKKQKKIWQSGGTFGFSSYAVIYPELAIAIVLLTNQADNTAQTELGHIADKIVNNMIKL
ncbi:serine hydrolase domain-containing protein [Flavihumibacter cheonanensis]|uniref:serine hydrolase domain-containing protein n=1 Tax=Flavihumibacter cheonanensis TaxID=1442385 RepID=UPI001EF8F34C|nr:serine hydrolase domain-containing protein [Flavihumibacter cheonanensis]MCG7754190.1 beta-lactamase family protein [Flavihumibacter cheonanensis]